MSLDRGTKIYAGVLGGIILLGVALWVSSLDLRLGEIDDLLMQDPEVAGFPYRFHALEIQGTTAVISSPRSTSVPAVTFLGMIRPGLANKSEQDPDVIAAQQELGKLQSKVREIVMSREDIDRVRWKIDQQWYSDHGVMVE